MRCAELQSAESSQEIYNMRTHRNADVAVDLAVGQAGRGGAARPQQSSRADPGNFPSPATRAVGIRANTTIADCFKKFQYVLFTTLFSTPLGRFNRTRSLATVKQTYAAAVRWGVSVRERQDGPPRGGAETVAAKSTAERQVWTGSPQHRGNSSTT